MNNGSFVNGSCVLDLIEDREALTPIYWDYSLQNAEMEAYASTVIQLVLFLTGVPLNLYIIFRILQRHLYSQPTYLLFLNLAFCDLIICLVTVLFNVITGFAGHYSFGKSDYVRCQVCKVASLYLTMNSVSSVTLALISLDRCAFFVYPLKYPIHVTAKKTGLTLLVVWAFSISLTVPLFLGYGDLIFSVSCGFIFVGREHVKRATAHFVLEGFLYFVVVTIIILSNVGIVYIVCKQIKAARAIRRTSLTPDKKHKEQEMEVHRRELRKQLRLCRVFGSILLVNLVTILPAIALAMAAPLTKEIPNVYYMVVLLTLLSQVTLRPLVEALLTPELHMSTKQYKTLEKQCSMYFKMCFCSRTCAQQP